MNFKKLTAIAFVSAALLASASNVEAAPRLDVYSSSINIEEDCSDAVIASATEAFKGKIEDSTLYLKKVTVEQAEKAIKAFSGVEKLRLNDVPVTNLNFLKDMPNLERLEISGDRDFDPIDISGISGNQKLEEVEFSSCKILDLAPISTCTNLKKFTSYSSKILSNTISPLKDLANLEDLNLYGTNVDDFAHLATCAKLEKINIYATKPIENGSLDYNHLSAIKSLEEIKAGLTDMDSVAFLKDLPKFKSIEFLGENIKDIETFENCKTLEYIMFWAHHKTDLDCNNIGKATSLKKLKFWSTDKVSNWAGLGNLTNLEELIIDGVRNCQTLDTAIDTSFLASLTKLKKVTLREVTIKDLAKLPATIKEINIDQDRIKPENKIVLDCSKIVAPDAKKLEIQGAKVSNIASIAKNLPKLEYLTLKKLEGIENYDFLKELPNDVRVYLPKDTISADFVKELKDSKSIFVSQY